MMNRSGFTLIEVSVAGSLIAFTVLTALGIIPYGLRTQNEARMRTAASAAVMTLGAVEGSSVKNALIAADPGLLVNPNPLLPPKITRWDGRSIISWKSGDPAPVSALWVASTPPGPEDLARRLVYSIDVGNSGPSNTNTRAITVWLISKDHLTATVTGPMSATYLTTFTELQ